VASSDCIDEDADCEVNSNGVDTAATAAADDDANDGAEDADCEVNSNGVDTAATAAADDDANDGAEDADCEINSNGVDTAATAAADDDDNNDADDDASSNESAAEENTATGADPNHNPLIKVICATEFDVARNTSSDIQTELHDAGATLQPPGGSHTAGTKYEAETEAEAEDSDSGEDSESSGSEASSSDDSDSDSDEEDGDGSPSPVMLGAIGRQNNLPVQPDSQLDAAARGSYPRLSGGMLAPLMEQTEDEEDESGGERSLHPLPAQERSDDHVLHYLLTNASWLVCSTMMSGPTCTTLPRFNLPIRALTVVC
jgi:hypothetical protein